MSAPHPHDPGAEPTATAPATNGDDHFDDDDFTDSAEEWELPVGRHDSGEEVCGAAASSKVPEHLAGIERELLGDAVPVAFALPDGTTMESTFYMGQTIERLKAYLEQQRPRELAYEKTSLYLGEKMLLDPLSLNDLPFKAGEVNEVRVRLA